MTRSRTVSAHRGPAAAAAPAVHLVTFGCQMNKYDSLLVEGRFLARGWRVAGSVEEADAVLFNTCSVREQAEDRVWSWLGALRREKERRPELVVGVLGCMAQRAGEEVLARAAHVDVVVGTRRLHHVADLVEELRARRAAAPGEAAAAARLLDVATDGDVAVEREGEPYAGGLAGHLAVMRGCDLSCTFCIVPTVRGGVRSRPIADLVREARWMVAGGARAITLLGQTVNSYGEDFPPPAPGEARGSGRQGRPALADLLRALQEVDGLARVRLVTLHPAYVTPALAAAIATCDKVERFLPLPAQSGSDDVLRRMRRGYTTDLYRRRVALLREAVPDVELGSDWIVGFPGESERDFEASERFCAEIGFAQGYVFQYSPRPGTDAAALADDVPAEAKRERNRRLLAAVERAALARTERWLGRPVRVLVESTAPKRPGLVAGRTAHGLPAHVPGDATLVGAEIEAVVAAVSPFGLACRAPEPAPA